LDSNRSRKRQHSGLAEHLDALGRWIATNTPKVLAACEKHGPRAAK